MSIKVTTLVWDRGPTDHAQFVVLLTLAEFANPAGECWPSVSTIAKRARVSDRSVMRGLKDLEAGGWLTVLRKSREHKGNTYQLILGRFGSHDSVSPEAAKSDDKVSPISHDTQSLDFSKSDDKVSVDNEKVRCQTRPSQVTNTTESGDKSANPPDPLIGRTVKNRHEPSKRTQAFVLPEWVPRDSWDGFMEFRTRKRIPATERALKLLVKKLEKFAANGQDPGAVLDQSTESGWSSLYPLKNNGGNSERKPFNRAQTAVDSVVDGVGAALASLGFDSRPTGGIGGDHGRTAGPEWRSAEADGRGIKRLAGGRD